MKNVIRLIAGLSLGIVLFSCDSNCIEGHGPRITRELTLSEITSFSFAGSGNVYIQKGEVQEVIVEGQANILDRLDSHVAGGHWDIDFDGCISDMSALNIYLTVPELEYISLAGSGRITGVNESDRFNELEINLSGSGEIEMDVYTGFLETDITGSGKVRIYGDANHEKIRISGSGDYKGYGIDVKTADIDITGSGNAQVSVQDAMDVRINGSGNVYYQGSPQINVNITGSGNVIKQ